jgi:4-amino-4-deoxy-L-arabinose transferase-like glycosyltransferase
MTRDRRIAWALFALGFFALLLTEKEVGFVRDESVYFAAAENHARWFQLLVSDPSQALTDEAIVRGFDFNHEHPALMKNLFGLSYVLFHEQLHLLRPAAAFRVPAFVVGALLLPLVYLLCRKRFGELASIFAAVVWLFTPRAFFESHLACFDVPMATAWVLVVYCFLEALERPRWWLYTGLAFGLALATKHNGYFIPVVLIPFSLWKGWQTSSANPRARELFLGVNGVFVFGALLYGVMVLAVGPERFQASFVFPSAQLAIFVAMVAGGGWLLWLLGQADLPTFRAVAPLVAMAALGPVIFYLHWPYLWHHPVDRTAWYFIFHLTHNHYAWFYLGELLRAPPFPLAYVLVKTALTVPTSFFVPMVVGVAWVGVRALRREVTLLELVLLANGLTSIALISFPSVPHFGGVKHWFPSMPFLAILAAGSLERGAKGLAARLNSKTWSEPRVALALMVAVCVPAVIATARIYEFGTSAYSELAGGLPGGASLGMQRQFWANNVSGVLPWLNANAPLGARVYLHENHGGQVHDLQRNGMVRKDLAFVGSPNDADFVAYQYMQEFRETEFNTWQAFGTAKPVFGLYLDETPQIIVYRRR